MAVKVKPPLNVKRPSDELVVVDVYGGAQTPSKPVNLVQNLLEQTSNGLGKALSSVGGVGGLLNSAAGILINNKGINGKDFAKNLKVSIHIRHCWRMNWVGTCLMCSTPMSFNPHPPLLADEFIGHQPRIGRCWWFQSTSAIAGG